MTTDVVYINKSLFFGLIKLNVTVTDRRPDMADGTNLNKYVTKVYFRYFSTKWTIEMYSKSINFVHIEEPNKETWIE